MIGRCILYSIFILVNTYIILILKYIIARKLLLILNIKYFKTFTLLLFAWLTFTSTKVTF